MLNFHTQLDDQERPYHIRQDHLVSQIIGGYLRVGILLAILARSGTGCAAVLSAMGHAP